MASRRELLKTLVTAPFAWLSARAGSEDSQTTPYVQRVEEDQAVLLWNSLDSACAEVDWLSAGNRWVSRTSSCEELPPQQTGMAFTFYQHRMELSGLTPDSSIHYRVRWSDPNRPPFEGTFRTPGVMRKPGRFVVLGDSGTGSDAQMELMRRMAADTPSFVVHTGDLAYPVASYQLLQEKYLAPYARLMACAPFFPCLGNHDNASERGQAYMKTHSFPADTTIRPEDRGRYYSVRWGQTQLYSLDTNDCVAGDSSSKAMLGWLRAALARNRAFWRVAFFHHPPYTSGRHKDDPFVHLTRERLAPILEEASVPLALTGHDHLYQRTHSIRDGKRAENSNGTVYVTTGGGGADIYPFVADPLASFGVSAHHYLRVQADGYRMNLQAIGLEGQELDNFTLAPPPVVDLRGVVNSATFKAGVAPGGLATVFGNHLALTEERAAALPVPPASAPLSILLNGVAVPVLFASPTQINFQIPFEIQTASQSKAQLKIETPNGVSEVDLEVIDSAPALFPAVFGGDGVQLAGARRVARGQQVTAYATGLGQVSGGWNRPGDAPLEPEGPRVLARVRIQLNGGEIEPEYAGLAQALPGVYRITFQVPTDCPSGLLEWRLSVGGRVSDAIDMPVA